MKYNAYEMFLLAKYRIKSAIKWRYVASGFITAIALFFVGFGMNQWQFWLINLLCFGIADVFEEYGRFHGVHHG